ncbi:MAG: TldD/PmbA family protein [Bdellovibrionales bacterium]|nr:TldD/PmbA family protein [Bdellovibrionales bacterium]
MTKFFMEQVKTHQIYEWIKSFAQKDSVDFDFHGFCLEQSKVLFEKQDLKNCTCSELKHLNLRVLKGDRAGTSYTKDFSKKSLEDCYQRAVDSLNFSDKKERGFLSKNESYKDFSPFYDEGFKNLTIEDKIKKAEEITKGSLGIDKRIQPVYSSVKDFNTENFFGNSEGSQSFYKANYIMASCYSLAIQENSRSESDSESFARNYDNIDFKKVGQEAALKALNKLNAIVPETKRYPVIFKAGPAAGELLLFLANLMNGKAVFEGASCLKKDSLSNRLFSKEFSLYDDPFSLWGFGSSPFDGEGFASEKTTLVEKGVLENYLTDSFFSKALKIPHTRKAFWNEGGSLNISTTNLLMPEGKTSFEYLVKEFPKVIIIDSLKGAGYNPTSGDFSKEAIGFLCEGGEKTPLHQFTVSGNIKDLFSNILKVGADNEIYAGRVKTPSFLVPDLMIAGK